MVKKSIQKLETRKTKLMREIIDLNVRNANAADRKLSDKLDKQILSKQNQVDKLDNMIFERTRFRL